MKDRLKKMIVSKIGEFDGSLLEVPPEPEMGDFALPCFFLAKIQKKSPVEIAEELSREFAPDGFLKEIRAAGPYVNFFISKSYIAKTILNERKKKPIKGKRIMVEYSSPNTNKPQHLGHIRNNLLGMSVSKILEHQGNKVIKANLLNDRGVGVTGAMLGYKIFGEGKDPDIKSDHFVGKFYTLFKNAEKENPKLGEEVREYIKRWEKGDKEVRALWEKITGWALSGLNDTYGSLGCTFDIEYRESEIYKKAKKIIGMGIEKGVFVRDEKGAIVAKLEGLPDKVVLREDGTSIYLTTDLILAELKAKKKIDRSIYVVGSEQNLYFKQLFAILERLGLPYAKDCYHLSYGLVYLPEGKMKSREGIVVDADDMIRDNIILAKEEVSKRYPQLGEEEKCERARRIGLAGLKFNMLKVDPARDIHFDPGESISFEGETGPYIQYTYARIKSILSKPEAVQGKVNYGEVTDKESILLKRLGDYKDALKVSGESYKPSHLCRYLIDLCQLFNEYYHNTPILKAPEDIRPFRLRFIRLVSDTISDGLGLLGIETLEEM